MITKVLYFEEEDKEEFARLYDGMMIADEHGQTSKLRGMECWKFIKEKIKIPDDFAPNGIINWKINWETVTKPAIEFTYKKYKEEKQNEDNTRN